MDPGQQLSYAVGYEVGHNLHDAGPYVDQFALIQGLEDIWKGNEPRAEVGAMRRTMIEVATQLHTPYAKPPPQGSDLPQRFCYALGNSIGVKLYPVRGRLDLAVLERAIAEGWDGKPPRLDVSASARLSAGLHAELDQRHRQLAAANEQKSEAFLDANHNRFGVKTTPSGLQYEELVPGAGQLPGPASTVTVQYSGSLADGQAFDERHGPGKPPARIPVDKTLPGLAEALQLMPVGSRYRFWLPPALGYGDVGGGLKIGPNQVLVFEVEMLKVE